MSLLSLLLHALSSIATTNKVITVSRSNNMRMKNAMAAHKYAAPHANQLNGGVTVLRPRESS